jgi:hypothetical protein
MVFGWTGKPVPYDMMLAILLLSIPVGDGLAHPVAPKGFIYRLKALCYVKHTNKSPMQFSPARANGVKKTQ